jgi:broad specificity phosphatase PhoE
MKEIYLIRHGETNWNKLKLIQGSVNDIMLNKTGKEQALYTGKYLCDYRIEENNFDLVLCSPMKRAKQTAKIICNEINYNYKKIQYLDELVEIDYGLLSGKTEKEMEHYKFYNNIKDPIAKSQFFTNIQNILHEKYNTESTDVINIRTQNIINTIKNSNVNKILIITHFGIINSLIYNLFNVIEMPINTSYSKNCTVTYITYDNIFKMIMAPSSLHFNIYNKNYVS